MPPNKLCDIVATDGTNQTPVTQY